MPLPARFGFWAVQEGVIVEVLVREATTPLYKKIGQALEAQEVPVWELRLVEDPGELEHPLPLRCDLKETLFDPRSLFERPTATRES